jgi:hypothetical protein
VPLLEALRNKDLSFMSNDDVLAAFLHFLCVQYMRTEKRRVNTLQAVDSLPGINLANVWGVLAHIVATEISYRLFISREHLKITLVEASTGSEFLTSDQPVFNLRAVNLPVGTSPDRVELYYPISPTIGLLLEADHPEGGKYGHVLDAREIAKYNWAVVRYSHEQVFASDEAHLRSILQTS